MFEVRGVARPLCVQAEAKDLLHRATSLAGSSCPHPSRLSQRPFHLPCFQFTRNLITDMCRILRAQTMDMVRLLHLRISRAVPPHLLRTEHPPCVSRKRLFSPYRCLRRPFAVVRSRA